VNNTYLPIYTLFFSQQHRINKDSWKEIFTEQRRTQQQYAESVTAEVRTVIDKIYLPSAHTCYLLTFIAPPICCSLMSAKRIQHVVSMQWFKAVRPRVTRVIFCSPLRCTLQLDHVENSNFVRKSNSFTFQYSTAINSLINIWWMGSLTRWRALAILNFLPSELCEIADSVALTKWFKMHFFTFNCGLLM